MSQIQSLQKNTIHKPCKPKKSGFATEAPKMAVFAILTLSACGPTHNQVLIEQSKAAIEAAQAAQEASRATQLVAGTNAMLIILVTIMAIITAAAIGAAILIATRQRTPPRQQPQRKWAPGPNARWQKQLPSGPPPIDQIWRDALLQKAYQDWIARAYGLTPEQLERSLPATNATIIQDDDDFDWLVTFDESP